jgi:hypothetical protein
MATSATDPEFDRFVRAQKTWDRAFACNIAEAHGAANATLVVGIIGRGHLQYGYGTPARLADLGISDAAVLLPCDELFIVGAATAGFSDAMFRMEGNPDVRANARSSHERSKPCAPLQSGAAGSFIKLVEKRWPPAAEYQRIPETSPPSSPVQFSG